MERKLEKEVNYDSDKTLNYSYYEAIQCSNHETENENDEKNLNHTFQDWSKSSLICPEVSNEITFRGTEQSKKSSSMVF
mgnify:CR=1 FL=1